MLRTHNCGELTDKDLHKKVELCGWVQTRRDHGGVIFIDLRDRYGLSQVIFDPSHNKETHKEAERIGREWVLRVVGTVRPRKEGMENPRMHTGKIEIISDSLEILSKSKTPPFEIDEDAVISEELRLKYRYLDLRRTNIQKYFLIRHKAYQAVREYLSSNGFLEVETPMLVKSTPEGARDYIVPSRVNLGKVYALPQSPQLYKQILMVAGFDRYFQIARCLRDEDLRSDRQPEFTQIDLEMSFVEEEDIYAITEGMVKNIFKHCLGVDLKIPFKRITHKEANDRFGSDKPDLRYGLELREITKEVNESDFTIFKNAISSGAVVKCLIVDSAEFTRNEIDSLIDFAKMNGAKGLAWMKVESGKLESNIAKYFSDNVQQSIIQKTSAKEGTTLLFAADSPDKTNSILSVLRKHIAEKKNLIPPGSHDFLWVTDFPLFIWNNDDDRIEAAHHLFTMPAKGDLHLLDSEPLKVKARSYDLTLNGVEVASGSIRNNDPELQKKVFKVVNISDAEAEEKFGFLLEAFKYGAPPHGGIAPGFDRLVALMCGFNDIREVIAFPKNKKAENPMDGCPSDMSPQQLKELGLKLDFVKD
ncbi:MAG: aspartate--tRNA ligase [Nanoarchaeota archaeon]